MRQANSLVRQTDPLQLAQTMAASGYFKDAREASQAAVKIMVADSLGLDPVVGMTGIHIVEGKPSIAANVLASLVQMHPLYGFKVLRQEAEICEIEFYARDGKERETLGVSTFTKDDAIQAGLWLRDVWKKYPRNMLFARAMSNGAKWFCPAVFNGLPVYEDDEIAEYVTYRDDDAAAPAIAPTGGKALAAAARRNGPQALASSNPTTAEAHEPEDDHKPEAAKEPEGTKELKYPEVTGAAKEIGMSAEQLAEIKKLAKACDKKWMAVFAEAFNAGHKAPERIVEYFREHCPAAGVGEEYDPIEEAKGAQEPESPAVAPTHTEIDGRKVNATTGEVVGSAPIETTAEVKEAAPAQPDYFEQTFGVDKKNQLIGLCEALNLDYAAYEQAAVAAGSKNYMLVVEKMKMDAQG